MPTFSFRGDSLYYEVCGAGPPWILHHGFGQRGRSWTEQGWTEPLSDRFTLVLLDAMGYGKSSRGGNLDAYLIPNRALALAALATHLGFVKFGVFGFSLGGRASLELGAIGDDRLGGMVVAGMKARMTPDDVRGTPARVRALRSGRVKSLDPAVRGPEDNDAESLALSLEGVARWAGVWDRIDRIDVPALLVCGDKGLVLRRRQRGGRRHAARRVRRTAGRDPRRLILEERPVAAGGDPVHDPRFSNVAPFHCLNPAGLLRCYYRYQGKYSKFPGRRGRKHQPARPPANQSPMR